MTSKRNLVAVALIVVSFVLLIPGLSKDLITITASITMFGNTMTLLDQTRSILQTVRTLYESEDYFVAGLIFLFSVVVPFVKGALLIIALLMRSPVGRYRVFDFVNKISKWAMADVFVVGVYVAYLSAKATTALDATLRPGFFYFTGYCLVSLLALQFMKVEKPVAVTE